MSSELTTHSHLKVVRYALVPHGLFRHRFIYLCKSVYQVQNIYIMHYILNIENCKLIARKLGKLELFDYNIFSRFKMSHYSGEEISQNKYIPLY